MENRTSSNKTIETIQRFLRRWIYRSFLLVVGVIVIGIVTLAWEYYLAIQHEEVQVGRNTTWIEKPYRDDGFPDYVSALEAEYSKDIDPKNNCVPILAKLIGPEFVSDELAEVYYSKLGVARPTNTDELFYDWIDYFGSENKTGISNSKVPTSVRDLLMESPWERAKHPEVAKWIEKNEPVMATIELCANKSQYYHPFIHLDNKTDVDKVLLQAAQELRGIFCFLACRGQLAIQEKQFDKAAKCADLLIKLSRLLDTSPFFIDGFIACHGGRRSAFLIDTTLATQANWNKKKIKKRIAFYHKHQPSPMFVERVNWGDRTMALDAVRIGIQDQLYLNANPLFRKDDRSIKGDKFAWFSMTELYKSINRNINIIIDYTDPHDPRNFDSKRRSKGERFLHFLGNHSKYEWMLSILSGRKIRSRYLAEFIVASRITTTENQVEVECKRFMYDRLVQVAWHFKLYELKHRKTPSSLDELVEEYPDLNYVDMFSGRPLIFKKQKDQIQIYSRGRDWKDDTNPSADDYSYLSESLIRSIKENSDDILITFPL